jgi:hypothetical protein
MRKGSHTSHVYFDGHRRFEHWYKDNQVYFITARVRDKQHAFESDDAKQVFWTQFTKYTEQFGFIPWVTSLMSNHYHTLGYQKRGDNLPKMIKHIHGSVAKLVNDLLPLRILPFWTDKDKHSYFDGCIRDVLQARRAFRYTYLQCRRHAVCADPKDYPHTRVNVALDRAIPRAGGASGIPVWLALCEI